MSVTISEERYQFLTRLPNRIEREIEMIRLKIQALEMEGRAIEAEIRLEAYEPSPEGE